MKPIKEIAGEILLFFYALQRKNAFPIMEIVRFSGIHNNNISIGRGESSFIKDLKNISSSASDIYNALRYLEEKRFIDFRESNDTGGDVFHSIRVTAYGVDIIEGIEREEEERKKFYITFNIKLAENINVESLIKTKLESLVKASLM